MKKILSLLLCLAVGVHVYATETRTFSLIYTVGMTYELNPVADVGVQVSPVNIPKQDGGSNSHYGRNVEYGVSDNNAFAIDVVNHIVYGSNSYHSYKLTPQKTGFYTFFQDVNGYDPYNGGSYEYEITYNITVVDVTNIGIPSNVTVLLGDDYTFNPIITHANATTTLSWLSSNTTVATIDSDGKLSTKGLGETTITCTAHNGVSSSCNVTVTPIKATGISLNYTSYQLQKNEKIELVATLTPSNTTNKSVTWRSSNEAVAIVASDGTVTGLAAGTSNIIATTADGSNISATCVITVVKDNRIVSNGSSTCQGGQGGLAVQLVNEDVISGLQFDLTLPEGTSAVNKSLSERCENHTISSNQLPDAVNTWRFVIISTSGDNITESEGTIANITIQADDDMDLGSYQYKLCNIILTKSDGTKLYPADVLSTLNVIKPTMGDVNNDNMIDIADAIAIVNHILKKEATVFVNTAADMNEDGTVDIGDAIAVVNLILKK